MPNRITIQFIGDAGDRSDVRLSDLIDQLKHIKRALAENEMAISRSEKPRLDYKVVDLRHDSPATFVLEPVAIDAPPPPNLMKEVIGSFASELRLIKKEKRLLREPELPRLQAYQDIGVTQKGRITAVKIAAERRTVTVDKKFKQNLSEIVGPDEYAEGTITGMLEALNFHNANKFTLYPPIGPRKVSGTFPQRLRPQVKEAVGSFVTINGKLAYKAWSPFPHGVVAEGIDIHEPDSALPTLTEMRGVLAGVTGDLNAVEFVNQVRNEEW